MCELEGGVTTGLLQGVKAALLFVASALSFCSPDHPEQCYTLPKLGATATVLLGTCIYYASCPERCTPGAAARAAASRTTAAELDPIETLPSRESEPLPEDAVVPRATWDAAFEAADPGGDGSASMQELLAQLRALLAGKRGGGMHNGLARGAWPTEKF